MRCRTDHPPRAGGTLTAKEGQSSIGRSAIRRHDGARLSAAMLCSTPAATSRAGVRVGVAELGRTKLPSCNEALKMGFKLIAKTLVYEYARLGDRPGSDSEWDEGWRIADSELVESAFRGDPERERRFRQFLDARYNGLILIRNGRWLAYGWCSNPRGPGPTHLPRWTGALGGYWIFSCHTQARFRGRGIYKQLLARFTTSLSQDTSSSKIFIDTHAENIPSRRAILASGFRPCGVFSTYRVWAPLAGSRVVGGRWRTEETHPNLITSAADSSVARVSDGMSRRSLTGQVAERISMDDL